MEDGKILRTCADCGVKNCVKMEGAYPSFCVSESIDADWMARAVELYNEPENNKVAVVSATVETDGCIDGSYTKTRVEETIEFAKRLGAKKIGLATCVGLLKETRVFASLLRERGFEVYGAGCKIGTVPKVSIGAPERCERTGRNMCNPIAQALLLNEEHTDLNVVIGLCVGHDALFYKYSEAITTTLIVKDRVLVNNPAAALYAADTFYEGKLHNDYGPIDEGAQ